MVSRTPEKIKTCVISFDKTLKNEGVRGRCKEVDSAKTGTEGRRWGGGGKVYGPSNESFGWPTGYY